MEFNSGFKGLKAPELHVDLDNFVFCCKQLKFNYSTGQIAHLAHFLSLLLDYSVTL